MYIKDNYSLSRGYTPLMLFVYRRHLMIHYMGFDSHHDLFLRFSNAYFRPVNVLLSQSHIGHLSVTVGHIELI